MAKVEKLYDSDNFLVVNKPYDMYINSNDEKEKNTVTHHIASGDSHLATSVNPLHFVQRLDYATSGVLCIAKTKTAAAHAGRLFEKRNTRKYYLAVVRGHIRGYDLCDISFEVGIDPATAHTSHKMSALTCASSRQCCALSRPAHTRLMVLEHGSYANEPVTVVLLKPITGRRHQLRVHCAAVGHTVLGDYTYSGARDHKPHRMFLHAMRLVLPLPQDSLDIHTPEPFFLDTKFTTKWKTEKAFEKYKTKEEFMNVCNVIDKNYVLGMTYRHFFFKAEPENNARSKSKSPTRQ